MKQLTIVSLIGNLILGFWLAQTNTALNTAHIESIAQNDKISLYVDDDRICTETHMEYRLYDGNGVFYTDNHAPLILKTYHGIDALEQCESVVRANPNMNKLYCVSK